MAGPAQWWYPVCGIYLFHKMYILLAVAGNRLVLGDNGRMRLWGEVKLLDCKKERKTLQSSLQKEWFVPSSSLLSFMSSWKMSLFILAFDG